MAAEEVVEVSVYKVLHRKCISTPWLCMDPPHPKYQHGLGERV